MKNWTKEEFDYLEDKWGEVAIPTIARTLGRSVNSVKIKAVRRGLGRHLHCSDLISVNQLFITITGTCMHKHNYKRLTEAGFPFIMKKSMKCKFRMVDINQFWEWLKENPAQMNISNLSPGDLGVEPDWVKYKRSADIFKTNLKTKGNVQWTKHDDERLKLYVSQFKYTYKDLSKMMLRTESAIRRRLYDLGMKQRPVRAETRLWTDEEVQTAANMNSKGYSYDYIAQKLSRTGQSVRGKLDALKHPERQLRSYRNARIKEG